MKPKNMPAAQLASNNTKNLTLTLTTTSGAASDGVKKNAVTAKLLNNGSLVQHNSVAFLTTGSALFENNLYMTSGISNALGEVKLYFTDTVDETVMITAVADDQLATSQSTFGVAEDKYSLTADVLSDHQPADGISEIVILYTLLKNNIPLSEVQLQAYNTTADPDEAVKVSTPALTDSKGQTTVHVTATQAGKVTIFALAEGNAHNAQDITFVSSNTGDISVQMKNGDFNLSNICVGYAFVAGQRYTIHYPKGFESCSEVCLQAGYYFDPATQMVSNSHGPEQATALGVFTGDLLTSFTATADGTLPFFTSGTYLRSAAFPGEGTYTFKIEAI